MSIKKYNKHVAVNLLKINQKSVMWNDITEEKSAVKGI